MALLVQGSTPATTGTDCLPCQSVRNILTQCGSCGQTGPQCSCQAPEYPAPCQPGDTLDPQCPNCCVPSGQKPCGVPPNPPCQLCPSGDVGAGQNGACPTGYMPDPAAPGCCKPSQQLQPQCPAGDTPAPCGPGTIPDPAAPNCCKPAQVCGPGEHPQPCQTGEQVDPQTGCCQPMPVEACFVCPGGLPELTAALQGQPNQCYLAGQFFLQPGALPPPAQA